MTDEPVIAVGLLDEVASVTFRLIDEFIDTNGKRFPPGEYTITCRGALLHSTGTVQGEFSRLTLSGIAESRFAIPVVIGINFHWQQERMLTFRGSLRFIPRPANRMTVVNDVPLETYILSVSCSEMNASSPAESLRAHSIISRSWLLAQLKRQAIPPVNGGDARNGDEIIRWYDRQAHLDFDVCADDHCQRYQGIDMITSGTVADAVASTRGEVLMHDGEPCDARFSKCCGGITEDYRLAWDDTPLPYLVPLRDAPDSRLPPAPPSDEAAARNYILGAPDVFCNCSDERILGRVLNNYDRTTADFFRWNVTLTPEEITRFTNEKLSLDLGRIIALDPVERGASARLKRLRIRGEKGTVIIGKELEIRRALSATHLYSSAFTVDVEGPAGRPDAFLLRGAGWGHGVGLCQIGAAVMACRGYGYLEILQHYYPGSAVERRYA